LTFFLRAFIQRAQFPSKFQAFERWRSKRSGEPKLTRSTTIQTQTRPSSVHREWLHTDGCLPIHGPNSWGVRRCAAIQPEPD
jgi:hypothetical protein